MIAQLHSTLTVRRCTVVQAMSGHETWIYACASANVSLLVDVQLVNAIGRTHAGIHAAVVSTSTGIDLGVVAMELLHQSHRYSDGPL